MQAITETSTNSMNTKSTIEINEANFEAEVLKSSQPLLVEFAKGCTRRTRSESSPTLRKRYLAISDSNFGTGSSGVLRPRTICIFRSASRSSISPVAGIASCRSRGSSWPDHINKQRQTYEHDHNQGRHADLLQRLGQTGSRVVSPSHHRRRISVCRGRQIWTMGATGCGECRLGRMAALRRSHEIADILSSAKPRAIGGDFRDPR